MKSNYMLIFTLIFLIIGCDQKSSVDSTKQRALAEQEVGTFVENKNLDEKALKMELELSERHYFYSAIEGQYQGQVKTDFDTFYIKFNIVRSLPQYTGVRSRQLSEIESELNNLSLYIHIVQWHPDDNATAVGCRINQVRPDMKTGLMTFSSTECPNMYTVFLSDLSSDGKMKPSEKSKNMAEMIVNHKIYSVEEMVGNVQTTSSSNVFKFTVARIK